MIALQSSSVIHFPKLHAPRYLIIVISKDFPVEVAYNMPLVVKVVVVHVEVFQPRLDIERSETFLPCQIRFLPRIEVHPNVAQLIDVNIDTKQTI
jgi:hypothetical protein